MTIGRTGRVLENRRHGHDRSDPCLMAWRFRVLAQGHVIRLAVARLDEQILPIVQLIGDAAIEHPSGHALKRRTLLAEDHRGYGRLAPAQALVNELDDVPSGPQLARSRHEIRIDAPEPGALLARQSQTLQMLQPRK